MRQNDIRPTLYYCNPNIWPEEEYLKRKNELNRYADKLGLEVIDDDYDHAVWLARIAHDAGEQGYSPASEPERGKRCLSCFKMRLVNAARQAQALGLEQFTTTLASSRWKSLPQIEEAGRWAAELVTAEDPSRPVSFWDRNWRKGGLQQRRGEIIKEEQFYNQLYCGCEYSIRPEGL